VVNYAYEANDETDETPAKAILLRAPRLAVCFIRNDVSEEFWFVHSKAELH
jgi:hypothetical protein